MRFYLGTHEPSWLGRSDVPLFVSLARADRFPTKRHHNSGWALDSGGFTQITERGGWTLPATDYIDAVHRAEQRAGGLDWIAPQDWMCEPPALKATGLTVEEHQHRTIANYLELRRLDQRVIPVLQGWDGDDHMRCVAMYTDAGVDLTQCPVVGVGTICRRQGSDAITAIVSALALEGLRLHGFGVKTTGLIRYGALLTSADSLAWSYRARQAALHGEGALGAGCTHRSCSNCFQWAHEWRTGMLCRVGNATRQMTLFEGAH